MEETNEAAGPRKGKVRDSIGLPFTIFRARDALDEQQLDMMTPAPLSEVATQGGAKLIEAGALDGSRLHLLFARPGLSLTHVWFKSGYPLPRHSHDAECLYFILAGSLRIGSEELGPGDGFFVGKDVPYAYTAGEQGVEVLEVRTADAFDIKLHANNPAWWDGALEKVVARRDDWAAEQPPSKLKIGED